LKKSSDRNKYKRWIRAAFFKNRRLFEGCDVLIMPRPGLPKLEAYAEIERAITGALSGKKD
jgi:ribonuclease P protein component